MPANYLYLCNDILSILKKEEASSDIDMPQVVFWVNSIANRMRLAHLGKTATGKYLNIFTNIIVQESATDTNPNLVKNRKYIDLPAAIYDIMYEKAIHYICHTQDVTCPPEFLNLMFQPTSPAKAHRLMYSDYEKPSPKNPYFYRVEQRLYFLGLENVIIPTLEMGLYTCLEMRTNLINLNDEIDLTDDEVSILRYQVLSLGAFSAAQPQDKVNDGSNIAATANPKVQVPQQQNAG